jgi:hypothetical protein
MQKGQPDEEKCMTIGMTELFQRGRRIYGIPRRYPKRMQQKEHWTPAPYAYECLFDRNQP